MNKPPLTFHQLKPEEIVLTIGEFDICKLEDETSLSVYGNGNNLGHRFDNLEELKKWAADEVITTESYWDCECQDEHYIHHKSTTQCVQCKYTQDKSPDSRLNEVIEFFKHQ